MMPTMTVVARASWAKSAQRNRWMSEFTAGKPATETVAWCRASGFLAGMFSQSLKENPRHG